MKVLVRVVATCTLIWAMSTAAIAQVESLNLWNAGIGGYDTYRVPGIVTTKKGVLLAYCGARLHLEKGDWSETNILLRRSLERSTFFTRQTTAASLSSRPPTTAKHSPGPRTSLQSSICFVRTTSGMSSRLAPAMVFNSKAAG